MVSFHSMTSDLRVHARGWGQSSKSSINTRMKYLIHILITIYQKAFRLGPEVQCRVSFHSMISDPRVHARGWGQRSKSSTSLKCSI